MALPELTHREALALDLESYARRLRNLVDRYAPDVDGWEAPRREDLDRVVEAIRALDRAGLELAPNLYARAMAADGAGEED